jgi:hypothetical protein
MTPTGEHRYRRLGAGDVDAWGTAGVWWPTAVRATSRRGQRRGAWGDAPEIIGPPRIFPAVGDDSRLWRAADDDARPRVRLSFEGGEAACGLLLFESARPGGVLRVAIGEGDEATEIVFEQTLARLGANMAGVLEVAFAAPRIVRTVELVCDGGVALDGVALVTATAGDGAGVTPGGWWLERQRRERQRTLLLHGSIVAALALLGGVLVGRVPSDPLPEGPLTPAEVVAQATIPAAVWANGPADAQGAPLLAPEGGTWSPAPNHPSHRELPKLEARFAASIGARAVVVVEAAGHGALRAVDVELADGGVVRVHQNLRGEAPATYGGTRLFPAEVPLAPPGGALEFQLPSRLDVRGVTLWFEPTRVPSVVVVDAVGLVQAR